ncbi:glycosyltransferase family 2 protein [Rhodoplanes sp. Z2-YC6860]|uniref:glycosyltransferase family 2 protein n=1 Tax=Rhodoplanes sp. Z2-YC6860 TaxID=674703 RepID=UPI00078ED72F|nr:glycosyltransferase family 2 protein [Rhodoplanes sp. Z2-YC6860]AMN43745.1 glycosyl transferase family 2 [Rhodoplanes sp. Z2-YC6860]
MIDDITPLIITYNEAENIARTLDRLSWARRIVLVDSGSTDETLAIARRYPSVDVVHRPFDDFANQCNFGVSQVSTHWVLSLDADYELSDALIEELGALHPEATTSGYKARFVYRIFGKPLRGTLYPARAVLYRKDRAVYRNEGHGHRVVLPGVVRPLANVIFHDDRKPLDRWFESQRRYARLEAAHLLASDSKSLNWSDRIRRAAWPAPILVFLYTLVLKRCFLDGWAGWYYALERLIAESLIALAIIDCRLRQIR